MSDWRHITLGDLAKSNGCTIQTGPFGSQLHKHEYQAEGIGVVNPTHMADRRVSHNSVPCVSPEVAKRLSKHQMLPGDLLFARRGEIGRHAIITESERGWLCGTGCFLVRVDSPESDSTYVSFYLSTDESVEWLNRHAAGVVMANLSNNVLQRVPISLPPLPEQKKIAHILSTVQQAIEAQERIIQTTTELKKALMHKLFTEGLRNEPQKQTEIGPVPESWEVKTVGDICRSIVPGRNKPKVFDGDIPWLTIPNIKGLNYINPDVDGLRVSSAELKSSGGRRIPERSVIMSCVGEFGVSAVTNIEIVINQQLHAFVCPEHLNPAFLCNQLRYRKPYMDRIAAITTIPYLNKSKCESVPIALPGRVEQDEIAAAFSTLDTKRDQHVAYRNTLRDLFRTLLHELMTAKTRV